MKVGAVTASTVLASGQFAVYALGTLQPGALSGDPLYVTLNADPINTGAPIAKPSSIIVSGLNCSVQVTNVGGAGVTGAGSPNVHVNWGELNADTLPAGSTAASAAIALTTTCSGTNSSDPDAQTNVATAFRAGPGAIADASGFIRENDITGYYLTLNQNLGSCDASQAVTGGTIGHHYEPGATGTVSTETVVASLCSDGTSAALGVHNINVVADLVNR
ncbi:hypothetical protein QOM18_26030 [Serratia marcescens]|uniref:hypothetical protein n=1 Tax=Serratia marcescens TaxID=615 RepID=UPI0024C47B5F|nr:hypothetical protein [Serratia marcescens]MDK1711770.1 hypothetical protein [Serratia marcescens]